jgi:hypothetical protein
MQEEAKTVVDAFAVGGTVGTLVGWLPPIASMLTIVWLGLRIWESDTVQAFVKKQNDR